MNNFYKTHHRNIIAPDGKPARLKGVNLGGWLMMEAYILHAPNQPMRFFKKEFIRALGNKAFQDFDLNFKNAFIQKKDIQWLARMGFNSLRVPFHYGLIETKAYQYSKAGLEYLDRVIDWARESALGVILDMHAAPGCQNHDWHSDSDGKAGLWNSPSNQKRVFALWEYLADYYKNNTTVIGYDLLNEAVIHDNNLLNAFYKRLISVVRAVDRNHILFIEGNHWAQDVRCLRDLRDDNWAASIHYYGPPEFSFNLVPGLRYPSKTQTLRLDKSRIKKQLEEYNRFAKELDRPIYVGEFGVNTRDGLAGEDRYLQDVLQCFNDFGFHWHYWTFKAVKNGYFPDGIFNYYPNPPWVARQGPRCGWDTYAACWPAHQQDMIRSWHTDQFSLNKPILKVLKDAL